MLLSALPVLLLQTFLGAQVSAELGIRAESRAGLLPTGIRTTDLTGDFSAATSLALLAANPRGRAGLIYSPQVSTRTGTGSSMLFFHRGALESSYRLTSRLGVSADVRGEIGEVDLLDIASIVERGPAGLPFLPETTKVRYRAASGNLGLSYRATERLGLDLNGGVSELVPMGNADDTLLQSQIAAQIGLSGRYQVNPRHSARLSVRVLSSISAPAPITRPLPPPPAPSIGSDAPWS
ncbi:MAG: hypothetical protein R3C68_14030 [Myxococcota bacterium]